LSKAEGSMIAINDIKQQARQTGITTFEVYTAASQALTTQDELINVGVLGASYQSVFKAISNLNNALDHLSITIEKPEQKQLIGNLKGATKIAQMALDLIEQSDLKTELSKLTEKINEELSFTKEILHDLIKVHIEHPKLPPIQYSDEVIKAFRETLTVDDILKEQAHKKMDKAKMDAVIKRMDIQDPINELLKELN